MKIHRTREASTDEENMNERVHKVQNGKCEMGICGDEAACKQHANDTFICLCPHDMSPPTKDLRCPTRKTVPIDPRTIKNIVPPQNNDTKLDGGGGGGGGDRRIHQLGFSTTPAAHGARTPSSGRAGPATMADADIVASATARQAHIYYAGSVVGLACVVLVVCAVLWRRSRACQERTNNSSTPSPIILKRNLLLPERYAPNPQYSVCAGNGVPLLLKEHIHFLAEIGEGCFGKVYKGELRSQQHGDAVAIVAVKVLKESASREAEEDFLREVDIMSAFRHENILTLLGVVLRDGNTNASPMMVFEFMPHGDLAEVLRAQNRPLRYDDDDDDDEKTPLQLSRADLLYIALQIANGMSYLASQRFVHRDLACRNCLVTDGPTVKIADFGMSRDVYTCDYYKVGGSRLLPVRWMSPESVIYGRFTLESDVWSFGIVLWEIYTHAKQPYYGHTNDEVVKLILQGIMLIPPDDCPPVICDLMRQCWKTEPRDRIKFGGIYDRLEAAYDEFVAAPEEQPSPPTSKLQQRTLTLPRPPPLPLIPQRQQPQADLLDTDGYLMPKEIKEPVQYLETLPSPSA